MSLNDESSVTLSTANVNTDKLQPVYTDGTPIIWDGNDATIAGALCFFVIGLADDLFALPPLPRLLGQVLVAAAVWNQGVRIGSIDLPFERQRAQRLSST